jgi:hypothetical protein
LETLEKETLPFTELLVAPDRVHERAEVTVSQRGGAPIQHLLDRATITALRAGSRRRECK